jgi:hypothetical protein
MITLVRPFAADNIGALVVMVTNGDYDVEALETSPHHETLRHYASPGALLAQEMTARPEAVQLIQPLKDAEDVEALEAEKAAAAASATAGADTTQAPEILAETEPLSAGEAMEVIVSRTTPVQA